MMVRVVGGGREERRRDRRGGRLLLRAPKSAMRMVGLGWEEGEKREARNSGRVEPSRAAG